MSASEAPNKNPLPNVAPIEANGFAVNYSVRGLGEQPTTRHSRDEQVGGVHRAPRILSRLGPILARQQNSDQIDIAATVQLSL